MAVQITLPSGEGYKVGATGQLEEHKKKGFLSSDIESMIRKGSHLAGNTSADIGVQSIFQTRDPMGNLLKGPKGEMTGKSASEVAAIYDAFIKRKESIYEKLRQPGRSQTLLAGGSGFLR